ncbi:MAG: serine hydrolase domain-containing protein [Erythrobacter sp.]
MRIAIAPLWLLLAGISAALMASDPPAARSDAEFDAAINAKLAETSAPEVVGVAYASAEDGVVTKQGSWGEMERDSGNPIADDTVFIIGSVSKSFTALAVMQLVEAGEISLDEPAGTYLPALRDTPAGEPSVRQFLSHTSGFSMVQGNESQDDTSMAHDALARRISVAATMTPAKQPGTVWDYSNVNYQVLGRIVEIVSGQSYADYVEQKILAPAGMADSFVHDAGDRPNMANGHRPWFGTFQSINGNLTGRGSSPQGGIVSSARDMARYLSILMNGEDDILSAAGKATMMSPASEFSPEYGFGWFIDAEQGTVFHSGANPGFEALATMIPAQKRATAVLVNNSSGLAFGHTLPTRNAITAASLDLPYDGEASPMTMRVAFIVLALLPFLYLLGMWRAWRGRGSQRSGMAGQIALYLPLLVMVALAYVFVIAIPTMFGAPFAAAAIFQPDTGVLLAGAAIMGVVWAVWRIAMARLAKP